MTNEEMLGVADIVERATNRFNAQAALHRERFDEHVKLIASMNADHEAKMVEHRAAFGARTEADAKIIAGLKTERDHFYQREGIEKKRRMDVEDERDGLLTQVQDMRAEMQRLSAQLDCAEAIKVLGDPIALSKERDALREEIAELKTQLERLTSWAAKNQAARETLQNEIEKLKSQTPKHPVKVGEWVRRTKKCAHFGHVAKVLAFIEPCSYEVQCIEGRGIWYFHNCEPCDTPEATHAEPDLTQLHAKGKEAWSDVPNATQWVEEMRGNSEATHDTEAGKAVAERTVRTEPVAEEIKVGDLVEVVSNTGRNTWLADVGSVGTVVTVEEINDSISVCLDDVPGKKNALAGYVSFCDVRKVTT